MGTCWHHLLEAVELEGGGQGRDVLLLDPVTIWSVHTCLTHMTTPYPDVHTHILPATAHQHGPHPGGVLWLWSSPESNPSSVSSCLGDPTQTP